MKVFEARAILTGLDLSRPIQYMRERMGYTNESVLDEVRVEYIRYMSLTVAHPETTIPTCKEVDELWHAHILCSHQYLEMCAALRVGYIHHNPCLAADAGTIVGNYNRDTLGLYRRYFGSPHQIWTADQELCSGDKDYCNSVVLSSEAAKGLMLAA
jgi:hypothetical protein